MACFLDHINPGAEFYLPPLIGVMKESEVPDVMQLARKIEAEIGEISIVHALSYTNKHTLLYV